jgi:hypothetical protein
MFSAARPDRFFGGHEPTEARQTNISCIAAMAIGALALALPMPSLSSPIPTQAPLAQVVSVEPAPQATAQAGIEPKDGTDDAAAQPASDPACVAQSWPYVCTEAPAGETTQRRVRVIAADRTAPSSLVVSASTRPAPVVASTTNEQPKVTATVEETPVQPLGAVTSDAALAAALVDVATPIATVADHSVPDAAAAATGRKSSKSKAPHAKRVRTARSRAQHMARTAATGRGALAYNAVGESADGALGYAAYPRHRMDSYPWVGLR